MSRVICIAADPHSARVGGDRRHRHRSRAPDAPRVDRAISAKASCSGLHVTLHIVHITCYTSHVASTAVPVSVVMRCGSSAHSSRKAVVVGRLQRLDVCPVPSLSICAAGVAGPAQIRCGARLIPLRSCGGRGPAQGGAAHVAGTQFPVPIVLL